MRKESKERVMRIRRAKSNEREKKEIWNKKRDKKKKKKRKHKLIHTDKQTNRHTDRQTDGRTDGQIDTNHSKIWYTILNNIVNKIQ